MMAPRPNDIITGPSWIRFLLQLLLLSLFWLSWASVTEGAGRVRLPSPFIPYGSVELNYASVWGDVEEYSVTEEEVNAGAIGYYLDQQLLWYNVSGFLRQRNTDQPGRNEGFDYGVFFDLNLLDLAQSATRFRNLPFPIRLSFNQYTAGEGDSFTRSYGVGLSYYRPIWYRFFENGDFVKVASTSGLREEIETEGTSTTEDIWSRPELDEFEAEPLEDVWGDGTGGMESGPVGWGDGSTIWEEVEPAVEEKKRVIPGGVEPMFSVPFPRIGLDYWHTEDEDKSEAGLGLERSLDLISGRASFEGTRNTFDASMSLEREERSDSGNDDLNEFFLRHVYRSPRTKGRGQEATSWGLRERLSYTTRSGDADETTMHFLGQHNWQRSNGSTRTYLSTVTSVLGHSTSDETSQGLDTQVTYRAPIMDTLYSDSEAILGYKGQEGSSSAVASLQESLEWTKPRLYLLRGDGGFFYSGDSVSAGGGTGVTLGMGVYSKTPIRVSDRVDYRYSESNGTSRSHMENKLTVAGRFPGNIYAHNQLSYKNTQVEGGNQNTEQQVLEYTLDASRTFGRRTMVSGGGRYQDITTDVTGGSTQLWSAYLHSRTRWTRSLTGYFNCDLRNLDGAQETQMQFRGQYQYVYRRIVFELSYSYRWISSDISGQDGSRHAITVNAKRTFGAGI